MKTIIKWTAVGLALGGWALVTFNLMLGLFVALLGSLLWVYVGMKIIKDPSIYFLNSIFVIIQISGIIKLL